MIYVIVIVQANIVMQNP